MNALEAFDLFVRCLESEGAQPVLAEARTLQVTVHRWFEQAGAADRCSGLPASNGMPDARVRRESVASPDSPVSLNRREHQILALLDKGLSNAQIARHCFISEGTVKLYLHRLHEKVGVGNRTALLHVVRGTGIEVVS